jgi:hypothetical protein
MDLNSDPFAQLSIYDMRHAAAHLARTGHSGLLHRLLALRRSDGSNAWYAAKHDADAYLADVSSAWDLASAEEDWGHCIRYAFIRRGMRRASSVPPFLLDTLVERDRLSLEEALSLARTADSPGDQIEGLVRLLRHVDGTQLTELSGYVLQLMRPGPGQAVMSAGPATAPPSRPLKSRQHVEVVARLAHTEGLDRETLAELAEVAREAPNAYSAALALATVAGYLNPAGRQACLEEAWSIAGQLRRFRGRPEAQAFVASRFGENPDGNMIAQALSTAVNVLQDADEHLKDDMWSPHGEMSIGRPALLRLEDFAAPLRLLARSLNEQQVRSVLQAFPDVGQAHAAFAVLAVLPRLAQLGFPIEAWNITQGMGQLVVVAIVELGVAGVWPEGLSVIELISVLASVRDPGLRAISRVALARLLDVRRRCDAIIQVLGETVSSAPDFRSEIIARLHPLIRSLPASLRDPLVADISGGSARLVRSAEDIAAILGPLTDLLPTPMLEQQLATARSIGLAPGIIDSMWRTPSNQPPHESPIHGLPGDVAKDALDIAGEMSPLTAAEMLVFLAPLLDSKARTKARDVARMIKLRQWQAEPLWRLLESESQRPPEAVAECVRVVLDASGLEHITPLLDDMATALSAQPRPGGLLPTVDAFLRSDNKESELAAAMPLILALGGEKARERVEEVVADLTAWFGTEITDADATPEGTAVKSAWLLSADPGSGAVNLIEAFADRQNWPAVQLILERLHSMGEAAIEALTLAERLVVDRLAPAAQVIVSADVDHKRIVASIAAQAHSRELKAAAHAALLRNAVRRGDEDTAAQLITNLEVELESDLPVAGLIQIKADIVEAAVLTSDMATAARHTSQLIQMAHHYTPTAGKIVTRAATALTRAIDTEQVQHAECEDLFRAYLALVHLNPEDYALQEAAGAMLRERVKTALAAGRRSDAAWHRELDALAEADDPHETILHTLAIEARCDLAAASAGAGDIQSATTHLYTAFSRWRRHPESGHCSTYFVIKALIVGTAAARAGISTAAADAVCLAWIAVQHAGSKTLVTEASEHLHARAAEVPAAADRLRFEVGLTSNEQTMLTRPRPHRQI